MSQEVVEKIKLGAAYICKACGLAGYLGERHIGPDWSIFTLDARSSNVQTVGGKLQQPILHWVTATCPMCGMAHNFLPFCYDEDE